MVIFLTYRMSKSEDEGFANPVDHNCSAAAGLRREFSETSPFSVSGVPCQLASQ